MGGDRCFVSASLKKNKRAVAVCPPHSLLQSLSLHIPPSRTPFVCLRIKANFSSCETPLSPTPLFFFVVCLLLMKTIAGSVGQVEASSALRSSCAASESTPNRVLIRTDNPTKKSAPFVFQSQRKCHKPHQHQSIHTDTRAHVSYASRVCTTPKLRIGTIYTSRGSETSLRS